MISLISAYFLVFKRTSLPKHESLFPYPSSGRSGTQFKELFFWVPSGYQALQLDTKKQRRTEQPTTPAGSSDLKDRERKLPRGFPSFPSQHSTQSICRNRCDSHRDWPHSWFTRWSALVLMVEEKELWALPLAQIRSKQWFIQKNISHALPSASNGWQWKWWMLT